MKKKKLKSVLLGPEGQFAVSDESGQVPELQLHSILFWARTAAEIGYEVDGLVVETSVGLMKIFITAEGTLNYQKA